MVKVLPGGSTVILENADVLETAVTLQILDPHCHQAQHLLHLYVAGIPQMPLVMRIFKQQLMRADRTHSIIEAVAAPRRLAFNMVDRRRTNDGPSRPRTALHTRQRRNHLLRGVVTEWARSATERWLGNVVPGDHPRPRNRILAQFHGVRRTKRSSLVKSDLVICKVGSLLLLRFPTI